MRPSLLGDAKHRVEVGLYTPPVAGRKPDTHVNSYLEVFKTSVQLRTDPLL